MMSTSVFSAIKLKKHELIRRTLKELENRQSFWRSTTKKGLTCYGCLIDFWNKIDDVGWYIPLDSKVKVLTDYDKTLGFTYSPEGTKHEFSIMRAWLYLTKHRGSNLNIIDSEFHFTSLKTVAMALLNKLSDNKFKKFSDVRDTFVRRYNQEALKEVLGLGACQVIVTGEDSKDFYEIITEILDCRGEYVAPLYNTGYSFLTSYPGRNSSFMSKALKEEDEPHIALYFSWFEMAKDNIITLDQTYSIMSLRDEEPIVQKPSLRTAEDAYYEEENISLIAEHSPDLNYLIWQIRGLQAKNAYAVEKERADNFDPFLSSSSLLDEIEYEEGILDIFGNADYDEAEDFG
jgi:hypothetical protein